jgi:hypothetical protein
MLRKTLLTVFTSAMLGAAVIAPDAALAFPGTVPVLPCCFPPDLPGGPPDPGAARLPHAPGIGKAPGPARHGGRLGLHGGQANFSARPVSYAHGLAAANGNGPSAYAYGYGSRRHCYSARNGVYVYSNSNFSGYHQTNEYSFRLVCTPGRVRDLEDARTSMQPS